MTAKPIRQFEAYDWAIGRPRLSMRESGSSHYTYREGTFSHPLGMAYIYQEASFIFGGRPITIVRFIWRGREYTRRWDRVLGDRTIARLARQMVEDIAGPAHG